MAKRPTKKRVRSDEQRAADDARLLASGEPLLTRREIARAIPISLVLLEWVLERKNAPEVRYIASSRPTLYCVRDVREAVAQSADNIEARRLRKLENVARSAARNAEEHEKAEARKALRQPKPPKVEAPREPEVIIRRRG